MKREEQIAATYLSSLGCGTFAYEPDGNIPPDFAIQGRCAVEVRRLNENLFKGTEAEGLEQLSIPLHETLKYVLSEYDARFAGNTFYVAISYDRSFPGQRRAVADQMRIALNKFLNDRPQIPTSIRVNPAIMFDIFPASTKEAQVFRHAASSDWDSGGMIVPIFIQNIYHCIKEKNAKISPYHTKYPEWWLLLVDNIGWCLDNDEADEIRGAISDLKGFQKVIVISPNGNTCYLELT